MREVVDHRLGLLAHGRGPLLEELLRRRRADGLAEHLGAVVCGTPRLLRELAEHLVELLVVELEQQLVELRRLRA